MSEFVDVDASGHPEALIRYLDRTDEGLGAMKAYMVAAARRAMPPGAVAIDLGCGAGHDLARLSDAGAHAVGVDASAVMVGTSRARLGDGADLVQADGAALPFASGSIHGVRIERVLQHVTDPTRVLTEVARALVPGGFLAAFEPDWESIRIGDDAATARHHPADVAGPDQSTAPERLGDLVPRPRHPEIGRRLPALVEAAGFEVHDVVLEQSRTERLSGLPWSIESALERAADDGRLDPATAARWRAALRAAEDHGTFRAFWTKVLVVASRRSPSSLVVGRPPSVA